MSVAAGTPVREALESAATAIAAAGAQTPRLDAEVLVADVLRVRRERLLIDAELEVSGDAVHRLRDAVRRRSVLREPVAYIVGRRAFRWIELEVDPRVLVPRPETELLVEVGLSVPARASVLDLCTGSGAVALALKHERPGLELAGSDVSEAALAVARANGGRLGLEVSWLHADLLDGIPDDFDALLANPPYVRADELPLLAPEVSRHEPRIALLGGADGLAVIAPLLREAGRRSRLRHVAVEVGEGQAEAVAGLATAAGFAHVVLLRDLAGVERVVSARR
ncbi:MAG: peptide chain release factor N(5)-glutamine methyltransferase [Solirubrobacteraceae bacterium]